MKLAKDGKGLPRGANKDPLQQTAPPAQEASRGPFKGHLYLRVSPISGSVCYSAAVTTPKLWIPFV